MTDQPNTPTHLTHLDETGNIHMVDVTDRPETMREAVAKALVRMQPSTVRLIETNQVSKGSVLEVAKIAGIMAAKQTSSLIPLCHPLPLSHADVRLTAVKTGYEIEAVARTTASTGVEMEALTAVAVAALTIYDMVKAIDKAMVIGDIRLVKKTK